MAININDYPNEIETGLKANKDYNKFLYRFKKDGVTKRGIIDVTCIPETPNNISFIKQS